MSHQKENQRKFAIHITLRRSLSMLCDLYTPLGKRFFSDAEMRKLSFYNAPNNSVVTNGWQRNQLFCRCIILEMMKRLTGLGGPSKPH